MPPRFKAQPEDFVVEEIPAYYPSGEGDHLYVTFTKRDRNTESVVRELAAALRVHPRDIGVAGIKDKVAVTTQTVSVPLSPRLDEATAREKIGALEAESLRVLAIARHGNKLKTGHLRGNRFVLWVRGVGADERALVQERIAIAKEHGVPNSFGDQRFGRHGDNAEQALAFVRGQAPVPRDPRKARFFFSALQSALFNALLEERVADDSWRRPLPGDLCAKHRSVLSDEDERGGLFACPEEEGPELEVIRERAERHEVSPTGPLFGGKMRAPSGVAAERERAVLQRFELTIEDFAKFAKLGEGTRRSLRLFTEQLECEEVAVGDGFDLKLTFVLAKGAYATEVLRWLFPGGFAEPERATRGQEPEEAADEPA